MDKKNVILNCIKELSLENNNDRKSFILVLDYICYKLGVKNSMFSSNETCRDIIQKHIPDVAVFSDKSYNDFLGEAYSDVFNVKLIDYKKADDSSCKIRISVKKGAVGNVYIGSCETGRVIMSFYKLHSSSAFYCVETDPVKYKIALANMKIYKIPSRILLSESVNGKLPIPSTFKNPNVNTWVNTKE